MSKFKQPKRYTISVTKEQAQIIANACEIVSRLSMAQLNDALDCVCNKEGKSHVLSGDTIDVIQRMVRAEVGLHPNASWGIRGKNEVTWEIYAAIRHRLSWDRAYADGLAHPSDPRDWSKFLGVNYDEPPKYSGHPLPVISPEDTKL